MRNNFKQQVSSSAIAFALIAGSACGAADDIIWQASEPQEKPSAAAGAAAMASGVAGAFVGVTCGVPIKTCKYIGSESSRMFKTLRSDFGEKAEVGTTILATVIGVPYGVASGTMLGLIHGVGGGISDGWHKPFSKKSIGLE